ncbi:hypothetical protein ABZ883_08065 [Streptomyces sp. NPDC046977]|uniref:hypothetical protein n=1 Tax=Streptomyces sp. NPDC046977 TaxID=3154703 RepID=UPI0033C896F0
MNALTLGPLELVADEWIIGDSAARKGKYLKLRDQGFGYWVEGVEVQVILWRRLMNLHLSAQPGRLGNSKALAKFTDFSAALAGISRLGGGEAFVAATLRHPYEDWVAYFTHAPRRYDRREIRKVDEFLKQTVECGRAARLGDPQWVGEAVAKIAGLAGGSRDVAAAVGAIVKA